jgi:DNA repair exonuclease SbcCD ATPase subunit
LILLWPEMNSKDKALTSLETSWQQRASELQAVLKQIRPKLLAAEQQLSERLAEISSFEFLVRSRLEPLNRRLEKLDSEIRTLENKLRQLRDGYLFINAIEHDELYETWRSSEKAGYAASGDFRYHEPPSTPPKKSLSEDQSDKLKILYRKLARRFHPDFALDEADRAYRTNIMMAINAAYTAGDIVRLQELISQPDPQRPDYSDEELAEALLREVRHCENRIFEIEKELGHLNRHPSAILKKRVDEAALFGRDLLEELTLDMREKIASRLIQRDVLQAEIEDFNNGAPEFADDAFADAVFNLGLERAFIDDDESGLYEWRDRHRNRLDVDETDDEVVWEALRKIRNKGRSTR